MPDETAIAGNESFISLELLAERAPEVRDDGDVTHPLYVGTPRTRFCDNDGNIELMAYACLLCAGTDSNRKPYRTPTGIVDHLRGFHAIRFKLKVPRGKVSKAHMAGRGIEARNEGIDGVVDERALVDHPCTYCHGMIRSGSKFFRAVIDGWTLDACGGCIGRLRSEVRRAAAAAPTGDATNVESEVHSE